MVRSDRPREGSAARPGSVRLAHVTTVPMTLRFFAGQPGHMRGLGIETIAISSAGDELRSFGSEEGVTVHAIPMTRRITPGSDLVAVARLARLLRRLRPDIVHAHTPKGGLLGMLAGRLAGVPVRIYHVHGLPFETRTGTARALLRSTERTACLLATRVIAVSRSIERVLVSEGLCRREKVVVLGEGSANGIDTVRFSPAAAEVRQATRRRFFIPDAAPVIGFVGRLVRDKGVVELLRAWTALRERWPSAHLLLVGPAEPQDPAPAEVLAAFRSDVRVHLAGLDWNTPPLFAAMDVVALPTYREGFPVTALETAAMGLPMVATSVSGCVDAVVDGRTGTLVPPRDAAALERAISRYLQDPALRAEHGEAARQRVTALYRPEVVWDALAGLYRELLDPRGRSGTAHGCGSGSGSV